MIKRIEKAIHSVKLSCAAGVITETTTNRFSDFLKSILNQVKSNRTLSGGQEKYLSDIEVVCSNKSIEESLQWAVDYNDDLREAALICAQYYQALEDSNQGNYFSKQREIVLNDPSGHVLSKKQFKGMCGNKFAVKVLQEMKREPKFSVGQMVLLRSTNRLDMAPIANRGAAKFAYNLHRAAVRGEKVMALVTSVDPIPIYRASKGGRVYGILPVGSQNVLYSSEKDLKSVRT